MSNEPTVSPAVSGTQSILQTVKKRVIPHEQSDPIVEPLFINFSHAAFLGDDFYLDVGVVTLESIDPELNPNMVGDFAVLNRLVMSKATMVAMRDQINDILAKGTTGGT